MKRLIITIAAVALLSACERNSDFDQQAPAAQAAFALSAEQAATFERTCALCHGPAGTGAPAPKDKQAWQARNAQGMEVLLEHTVNGYGGMPPMGMCMECSQEDFAAFIQYMSGLECEE